MTKQTGLGAHLWHNGYLLSNDFRDFSIASPRQTMDVTGINKSAFERILLHRDGQISGTVFFNDAAGRAHPVISALPTGDQVVTITPVGAALGYPAASMAGKQINYDGNRDASGELTFSVDQSANGSGVEWGLSFGELTHTSGTASTSINHGAASTFGWAAYLHVTAFSGTNCTVTIQQSSDNGGSDAFATLGAFTAATAITAERISGTGNVEQYVRVITSGTFTSITFTVNFVRYEEALS